MTTRPDMECVLIATDGSESAREALHVGLELAAEQGAPVTIVHVGENGVGADISSDPQQDGALREAIETARRMEIEPDVELLEGDPAEEIVKLAERLDADLVIVGSRGLSRASATLIGSVSRAVLDQCAQPVMMVRGRRTTNGA